MSARKRYRLPDEPRPNALTANATDPMWPFLAFMLVGAWFGLAWFAFNALALGSPTWRREGCIMLLALGGSALLVVGLNTALANGWLDQHTLRYAALSIVCLRLACAYALNVLQNRVFELHSYYGGSARGGATALVGAMFILRPIVDPLLGGGIAGVILK